MNDSPQHPDFSAMPAGRRILAYLRLSGPGYLQSAMTLGAGTMAACITYGSMFGYQLLWVQLLAMVLGYFLLAAVAKQVTVTGERPYRAVWTRIHPAFALLWGIGAWVATIVWHFPQYTLTANGVVTLLEGSGLEGIGASRGAWFDLVLGAILLTCAVGVVELYHSGSRGVRYFENATKVLVWLIVAAFASVALATGIQWERFFLGITGISFFRGVMENGMNSAAIVPIAGGLAAAVGINMLFLYPYSLLNKGWRRNEKELAYFDLLSGMALPFMLATIFVIIATANTIGPAEGEMGSATKNILDVVPVLAPTFTAILGSETAGFAAALWLLGLGMMAVGFTSIITHMLACGFIGAEIFNLPEKSRARFWFSLTPAIGVLGVTIKGLPWQAAVTASSLNAPLLPIAALCFLILLNKRSFMGEERPRGLVRLIWNVFLVASIAVMCVAGYFSIRKNLADLSEQLSAPAAAAAVVTPAASSSGEQELDRERVHAIFSHVAMDSDFRLEMFGSPEMDMAALADISRLVFDVVDGLESRISNWIPRSELSRLNQAEPNVPQSVSPSLFRLLTESKKIHSETGGVFDPTVGPLLELWGFYRKEGRLPSKEEIDVALARVGLEHVHLNPEDMTVTVDKPGIHIDLGGIGKGLAVDHAARMLGKAGITDAFLDFGGSSMLALGAPPGKPGWTVRIKDPYNEGGYLEEIVLRDESLSTASASERFFEIEGRRYGHIFDPRTGYPVESELLSASVVGKTATLTDGLDTAFFIMGIEGTRAYCRERPDVRVILVTAEERPQSIRINFDDNREG